MAFGPAHLKDMRCSGHGCFPPRPNIKASTNVLVNNIGWHRETDGWATHCCKSCHASNLKSGSGTVFANGLGVARPGDPVACGSVCMGGSNNVYAGD